MTSKLSLKQQLQQNLLAIISIAIAIGALGYNTWRNELSEENRNHRAAGFEIMKESAQLQYLIDTSTYISNESKPKIDGHITGWVTVNQIVALSELMKPEIKLQATQLRQVWDDNWQQLADGQQANENITAANRQLMNQVRSHLLSLH